MASLAGLAYWAMQNKVMGHPLRVNVGGKTRCMVAEMAPNVLATAAGEGPVPQIRFICDGYCAVYAKRPSKQCRKIDRAMVATTAVPAPAGLIGAGTATIATPYRSGEAISGGPTVGGTPQLPPPGGLVGSF